MSIHAKDVKGERRRRFKLLHQREEGTFGASATGPAVGGGVAALYPLSVGLFSTSKRVFAASRWWKNKIPSDT